MRKWAALLAAAVFTLSLTGCIVVEPIAPAETPVATPVESPPSASAIVYDPANPPETLVFGSFAALEAFAAETPDAAVQDLMEKLRGGYLPYAAGAVSVELSLYFTQNEAGVLYTFPDGMQYGFQIFLESGLAEANIPVLQRNNRLSHALSGEGLPPVVYQYMSEAEDSRLTFILDCDGQYIVAWVWGEADAQTAADTISSFGWNGLSN